MQTRTAYLQQLDDLGSSLDAMARVVVSGVRASAQALAKSNEESDATAAIELASVVEERRSIEATCLDIMFMQQPLVAGDLRFVTGAFRIVSDLSHIDEKAHSLLTLAKRVPAAEFVGVAADFSNAAENVAAMVDEAVAAFRAADTEAANHVFAMDDAVDEFYGRIQQKVVSLIRASEGDAEYLPELLMMAKYYERMGDDAQRIAAWAVFRVTGEHEMGEHAVESASD